MDYEAHTTPNKNRFRAGTTEHGKRVVAGRIAGITGRCWILEGVADNKRALVTAPCMVWEFSLVSARESSVV